MSFLGLLEIPPRVKEANSKRERPNNRIEKPMEHRTKDSDHLVFGAFAPLCQQYGGTASLMALPENRNPFPLEGF